MFDVSPAVRCMLYFSPRVHAVYCLLIYGGLGFELFNREFEGSNSPVQGVSGASAINPRLGDSASATYAQHTTVGARKL